MYPHISKLHLSVKLGFGDKTIIDKMFFTPPFKIIEPFYDESTAAHIILMVASAGLMAGDRQEMLLEVSNNARLHFTTQSFEKIHDTKDSNASRTLRINVGSNGLLDFNPLACILFANASFYGDTLINLKEDSILYFSEILAAKSVGSKNFVFKKYSSKLKIFIEDKLCFYDNMHLMPQLPFLPLSRENSLDNLCVFGNFSHYLNLLIIDKNFNIKKALKILESNPLMSSITAINGGYCLKALAHNSEALLRLRENILKSCMINVT